MEISGENLLPWEVYKPYFFLEKNNINETSFKVYCLLCLPTKIKVLSTSKCSASNLLRHMRKLHPDKVPTSKIEGPGHKKSIPVKRKLNESEQDVKISIQQIDEDNSTVETIQEYIINTESTEADQEKYLSQHKVDQLIIDFIVSGLYSPSIVERSEFQNLISGLQPGRTIMSKMCLENIISDNANNFRCHLQDILAGVNYVAITADGWRAHNRCYVGISAHWYDTDRLDRHSAVLACRTTIGAHTYNEVSRVLDEVQEEFGIQSKIVQIVTDNGFNFAKCSRSLKLDENDDEEETKNKISDLEFVELTPILDSEETNLYNIPPHERCIVHTMFLIVTVDTKKAESNQLYKDAMTEALYRAQNLWKLQTSSPKTVEFVKEQLSQLLVEPKDDLWTSQFEALKYLHQILKEKMDNVNNVCDGLEIPRFREKDKIFIDEYCKVMKPVAAAIDALKSEKNAFLGIVLPVLYALRRRLVAFINQACTQDVFVVCHVLVEAVIKGIDDRFLSHMLRTDLVLAAALHPEFQLTWLKDSEKEVAAIDCLKDAVRKLSIENSPADENEDDDDLFDFKKPLAARNNGQMWENEVEQYLKYSNGEVKCLHNYPIIKELFIQYNTALPSSAAAEKTFCATGELFTYKHGSLPDLCVEDMLLMKVGIR